MSKPNSQQRSQTIVGYFTRRRRAQADRMEQRQTLIGRSHVGDLNKLFNHRYGGAVYPDDDDGRHSLMIMLHHYARNNPLRVMKIMELPCAVDATGRD